MIFIGVGLYLKHLLKWCLYSTDQITVCFCCKDVRSVHKWTIVPFQFCEAEQSDHFFLTGVFVFVLHRWRRRLPGAAFPVWRAPTCRASWLSKEIHAGRSLSSFTCSSRRWDVSACFRAWAHCPAARRARGQGCFPLDSWLGSQNASPLNLASVKTPHPLDARDITNAPHTHTHTCTF